MAGPADWQRPLDDAGPACLDTEGRENAVGAKSVAVPGNLLGWTGLARRHGRLPLADLVEPAIRHARRGFRITGYLSRCIDECLPDLVADPEMARHFVRNGRALAAGDRLVMADYAGTLGTIAKEGAAALREMLHLYARDKESVVRRHLEGVRSVRVQPITRRMPGRGFARSV